MRIIDDILKFRGDISPFLVHLTRRTADHTAHQQLEDIVRELKLIASGTSISDARFGTPTHSMTEDVKRRFFGAVCFTETPLNEVHCMLEVANRQVNLEPYGLVFLKARIQKRGVGPVFYFNNEQRDKDDVISALCELIETKPAIAEKLLPMVSNFGLRITAPGAMLQQATVDFLWEREWRLPSAKAPFEFTVEDIFVGLCPHDEIAHFEALLPPVGFIDPTRNMKWYATKLIEARQRHDLKSSVI